MAIISEVPLVELDGRNLYYTFLAGARKVIAHQIELNRAINVFPVNDGDTGTNLASTIRAVIESLHPHRSYKITADDRMASRNPTLGQGSSGGEARKGGPTTASCGRRVSGSSVERPQCSRSKELVSLRL